MKGIILAAGEGRRLRPLTEDKPKSMIDFCGMTLLQRQVNVMKECDINDIIDQKLSYLVENKIEKILDEKIPKLLKNYFDSK